MGRKNKTTGKKITRASTLGRSLMKAKKRERLVRVGNAMCREMHITDIQENNDGNMQSILERNALDEFLETAIMANKDFKTERSIRILDNNATPDNASVASSRTEGGEGMDCKQWNPQSFEQVRIPKRPKWEGQNLSAEQLDRLEKDTFLDWRRELAKTEESGDRIITPYEKNLNVWRQLWRVVERSDVVVQIVDARNPLLFRCEDLDNYVQEIASRQKRTKKHILVINKSDYLSDRARQEWKRYFDSKGIPFVFWSAHKAEKQLEQQAREAKKALNINSNSDFLADLEGSEIAVNEPAETHSDCDLDRIAVTGSQERVLSRGEILELFETLGNQAKDAPKPKPKTESTTANTNASASQGVTIGMIGYPNVGKSSTVNVLMGEKKVSVSATPGKTKHFQTLQVREGLVLCDCPGLVFPAFMKTKAALVANGVYPIAQLREYSKAVDEVISRITRGQIQTIYRLTFPTYKPVTSQDLMNAHARMRGFMKDHGRPDDSRSARIILSDFVNGKLLFCHPPPGLSSVDLRCFLISVQGSEAAPIVKKSVKPSVPRGIEVWGGVIREEKDTEGLEQQQQQQQQQHDEKLSINAENTSASAPQEPLTSEPPMPIAAGDGKMHKDIQFIEDHGILDGMLEAKGEDFSDSRKPNTNRKMSKRERRRLRKLNKMNNQIRRDAGGAMKRAAGPAKTKKHFTKSANGSVMAVTWNGIANEDAE